MVLQIDDQKIKQLESQIKHLEQIVKVLGNKISLLERENNRRKAETSQIASALRK